MKAFKIPVCLFILTLCLNGFAQTDKEARNWVANKLEEGEKSFRASARGETNVNFYVKFDGCKASVTRLHTFTGALSASAFRDGGINTGDRYVSRSRNNYTFNLKDIDFNNIKFLAQENKEYAEIIVPVANDAKLIKAKSETDGMRRTEFISRLIFRVDKTEGERVAGQLAGIARNCR